MAKKQADQKQSLLSRREVLSTAAMGAGFLASIAVLGRFISHSKQPSPRVTPLPGEGSIFQPRRDARLQEWERKNSIHG